MRNCFLLLIAFCLFSCKGRLYRAPSGSMAETIKEGESFYIAETDKFSRNDIVSFDTYALDYGSVPDENGQYKMHWERRVCRLIAIPGDTLQVRNDTVLLNHSPIPFPPGCKLVYDVYTSLPLEEEQMAGNEYTPGALSGKPDNSMLYQLALSRDQKAELEKNSAVIRIEHNPVVETGFPDTLYATISPDLRWNTSNYGPLRIPGPGETVEVTAENFKLYQNIPGIKTGPYKITEQLYFVMGDNRHLSQDSRFIGFIPNSRMYGIVK